jgi:hypothetical protein
LFFFTDFAVLIGPIVGGSIAVVVVCGLVIVVVIYCIRRKRHVSDSSISMASARNDEDGLVIFGDVTSRSSLCLGHLENVIPRAIYGNVTEISHQSSGARAVVDSPSRGKLMS